MSPEIVITGVGPVSAIGVGKDAFLAGMREGRCGIAEITAFDTEPYRSHLGAEVVDFDIRDYLESAQTYLDPTSAFALAACRLALQDAGLAVTEAHSDRIGLALGTGYGCLETMRTYYEGVLERGAKFARSFLFSHSYANTPASLAAIEFRLRGPHTTLCTGLSSGAHALAYAVDMLRSGQADVMLAGGTEALSEPLFVGLSDHRSPQDGREERCCPFDERHNGLVLGEGAGVVVLETRAHAVQRGAGIYGFLVGLGLASDFDLYPPQPPLCKGGNPAGGPVLRRATEAALAEAGREAAEVDVLFAAANSVPWVDEAERSACEMLFGGRVPVTALKSQIGECVGASDGLNCLAAALAVRHGLIPPTVNCEQPGPGLNLIREPREGPVHLALVHSVDLEGGGVALLLSAAPGHPSGNSETGKRGNRA